MLKIGKLMIIAGLLLLVIPVSAVTTAEQSVGDTLVRGGRFTVTITGLPNTAYYLWLPHTSSMTGGLRDQPPVIAGNQANVVEDPPDGPYTIGSYQYNNGNGQTIRDDVAPSAPGMPNTRYYAQVTTDSSGVATVEFLTSVNTGLRSYSVRVENPRSPESSNLFVEVRVYSRQPPVVLEIITTPSPLTTAAPTATTESPVPVTTMPVTITPEPVKTTIPAPATTQKSPAGIGTVLMAAVGGLLILGRR